MQPDDARSRGLIVTVDLEDHHGTGALAEEWADFIRDLAESGHEIALHGYEHSFIDRLGHAGFREDLRRGVDALGNILGAAPSGYRAPYFSLTRATPWAPAEIAAAGFTYSSSVLPAWNPQAGLPGAPRSPFRWPTGLLEFPVPVMGPGAFGMPFLGGAYLRLLPWPLVQLAARMARAGSWTYSHPYDFDVSEPFTRLEGQQWWVTRLLFMRRDLMLERVMSLAGSGASPTLADVARDQQRESGMPAFSIED